jgi:hypothetical protein
MTIVFGCALSEFAVLAVDQLVTTYGPRGNGPFAMRRKLVVHPTLPIAVTSKGLSTFYDPKEVGSATPSDALAEVTLHDVLERDLPNYSGDTSAPAIADFLGREYRNALDAIVRAKNIDIENQNFKLRFYALGYDGGAPSLGEVTMGATGHVYAPITDLGFGAPPASQKAIELAMATLPRRLIGRAEDFSAAIAPLYEIACRQETLAVQLGQAEFRTIGGPLDIAVVDRNGKRSEFQIPQLPSAAVKLITLRDT